MNLVYIYQIVAGGEEEKEVELSLTEEVVKVIKYRQS